MSKAIPKNVKDKIVRAVHKKADDFGYNMTKGNK